MKNTVVKSKEGGFTLLELMIVIAIIGILAAIAIPNFLAIRKKGYCTRTETDLAAVSGAISDYYADPSHILMLSPGDATVPKPSGLGLTMSGGDVPNRVTITGDLERITISVEDSSRQCPTDYQKSKTNNWSATRPGIFTKTRQ